MLLTPCQLEELLGEGKAIAVDCRFDLRNPLRGRELWIESHIPGARHADLDHDLASPVRPDSGRHPLPSPQAFSNFLASIGWRPGLLVVAYDGGSGALAARLWWLLRYFGIGEAALLDGGFAAWCKAGLAVEQGVSEITPSPPVSLNPGHMPVVATDQVKDRLEAGQMTLIDARDQTRFRGEQETIDTRAGHIPGAVNKPFGSNLDENGLFASPESLRAQFESLIRDADPNQIAHSCGSGVTACHNLFAMELAGLEGSALYAGSWSEWIRDPDRPVASGD